MSTSTKPGQHYISKRRNVLTDELIVDPGSCIRDSALQSDRQTDGQ